VALRRVATGAAAGVASSRSTRVGADGRSVRRAWHGARHRVGVRQRASGGRGSPAGEWQARPHGRRWASPNAVLDAVSHRSPARAEARPDVAPPPSSTTATAPATAPDSSDDLATRLGPWRHRYATIDRRERISSLRRLRERANGGPTILRGSARALRAKVRTPTAARLVQ